MSLHGYLKTRQAALEQAYAKLREKTASPYTSRVRDLCGLLVVREELRNIAETLGEQNPDAGFYERRFSALDPAERKQP